MKTSFHQTVKLLALSLAFVTSVVAAAPELLIEQPADSAIEGGVGVGWGYAGDGQVPVPAGVTSVKAIAAGVFHCLALKANGEVVGWGSNSLGQALPPVAAQSGVKAIAAGDYFSMALKQDGTVVLWGNNSFGELDPPFVLSGVRAIAAGGHHGIAILEADGSVVSWGDNTFNASTPPPGLLGVKAIAAGALHSVAILSDDSLVAWGLSSAGRTTIPSGLGPVQAIAAGADHSLALKSDGTVAAWGSNAQGQCTIPGGLSGVKAIAGGGVHSLALKTDGSVVAWGSNSVGQITVPPSVGEVQAIAAGDGVSLAVMPSIVAYGNQTVGYPSPAKTFTIRNTGDAALTVSSVAVDGGDAADFSINTTGMLSSVPAGGQTTFSATFTPSAMGARKTTLRVLTDDADESSYSITLSGTGTAPFPDIAIFTGASTAPADERTTTQEPHGFGSVYVSSTSTPQTFTITNTGTADLTGLALSMHGTNASNFTLGFLSGAPLAPGATRAFTVTFAPSASGIRNAWVEVASNDTDENPFPIYVTGRGLVAAPEIAVDAPGSASLGGIVRCWGANSIGQSVVPVGLSGVLSTAAGLSHTLALKNDGTVVAWGDNSYGQTTIPVAAQTGVKAIAASFYASLALKDDGSVVFWGDSYFGQLTVPLDLAGVVAISAGGDHFMALTNEGRVVAWGSDVHGQSTVPPSALSGVVAIAGGDTFSLALKTGGTVIAWGSNQLGPGGPISNVYGELDVPHSLPPSQRADHTAWRS